MDIAQFNMVEQQIRPWNVHDSRLLAQMTALSRTHFVPQDQQALCWVDTMIHLADGARMLEPKTAARMIQALNITPQDKVLVVGAGSGYSAALCAGLAKTVDCIDHRQAALDRAMQHCEQAGVENINFQCLEKAEALSDANYDAILIRERCSESPEEYFHSLAENGRCVAAVGGEYVMELICYTREGRDMSAKSIVEILTDSDHSLTGLSEVKETFVF